jgi:hypothetical protein
LAFSLIVKKYLLEKAHRSPNVYKSDTGPRAKASELRVPAPAASNRHTPSVSSLSKLKVGIA